MGKIGIVTDSSGDLPLSYYSSVENVIMLPLQIRLGLEAFRDDYDISSELPKEKRRFTVNEFYREMRKLEHVPNTAPVPVSQFLKAYEKLSETCDLILSVHFSSRLGYTVKAAQIAADKFKKCKVEIFDTLQISNGYGALIKETVRLRDSGATPDELITFINKMIEYLNSKFIMTSKHINDYLYRSRRINLFVRLFANLIQLKSYTVKDGKVTPLFKYLGRKGVQKVLDESIQSVKDAVKKGKKAYFVVSHADNEEYSNRLIKHLKEEKVEYEERFLGPITGVYGGAGLWCFIPIIVD